MYTDHNFGIFIQYYDEPTEYKAILKYINMGFTIMFTIECVLKLLGFGRVRTHSITTPVPHV